MQGLLAMSSPTPGDVVRLMRPLDGLEPGLYGFLSLTDGTAAICPAQRFKDGQIRAAGRIHRLNVYLLNACFERTDERLADRPHVPTWPPWIRN